MKRNRRVKIVATLGPASSTPEIINELFERGADVFRINMSHTSHEQLRDFHKIIRAIEIEQRRPIAILVDLQGPKIRVGTFEHGEITLMEGAEFYFRREACEGNETQVHLPHGEVFSAIEKGHCLLLDDGRLRLNVVSVSPKTIETKVELGGVLSDRKGVGLPDTLLPFSAMTEKDHKDLDFALSLGVDWIALSFVQRPEDVAEAHKQTDGRAAIMAKIEKPMALKCLDEIIELCDGLMIARGDLGVELPVEQVPGLQKQITRAARTAGIPVIVATQMLETMVHAPVPTRAEVSDVATAVFEGADAIMLSAESASGEYPIQAVAMMDTIAQEIEQDPYYADSIHALHTPPEPTGADAISAAARSVAETLKLGAIVCYTSSGATGLRAARERPRMPIIVLSPKPETGRKLAVAWGVHCVLTEDAKDLDDMVARGCRIARDEGFVKGGDRAIILAGVPLGTPGATNMLRVARIRADRD